MFGTQSPTANAFRRSTISRSNLRAASRCTCVDLPYPSEPSNVMNGSGGMMSLVRRHCACKGVFQSSKSQQPSSKEPATFNKPSTTDAMLELEVSLDVVSLEFMKSFWLVKQEPSSYSWSDFVAEGQTSWTGVRNYTARNNLRKMRVGDEVLFYHSGEEKAVVGIAKVMRTAYPDPTAKEGDWSTLRSCTDQTAAAASCAP